MPRLAGCSLQDAGSQGRRLKADMTLTLAGRTALTFPVTYTIRWVDGLIDEARVNVYLESRMAVAMSAFNRLP